MPCSSHTFFNDFGEGLGHDYYLESVQLWAQLLIGLNNQHLEQTMLALSPTSYEPQLSLSPTYENFSRIFLTPLGVPNVAKP